MKEEKKRILNIMGAELRLKNFNNLTLKQPAFLEIPYTLLHHLSSLFSAHLSLIGSTHRVQG